MSAQVVPLPTAFVGYLAMFLQIGVLGLLAALIFVVRGSLAQQRWDAWMGGLAFLAAGVCVLAGGSLAAGLGGPAFTPLSMALYMIVQDVAAVCFIAGGRARNGKVCWPPGVLSTSIVIAVVAIGNVWLVPDFVARYTIHGVVMFFLLGWAALETAQARARRPGIGISLVALALALLAVDYGQYAVLRLARVGMSDRYIGVDAYVAMLLDVILGFGIVIVSADRAQRQLRTLAISDSLSGLRNRNAFAATIKTPPARGAVAMIDLNRLKHINDSYGHRSGDRAIAYIGVGLRRIVTTVDHAFRIGGDEFALIVPEGYAADLDAQLARVHEELAAIEDPERGHDDPLGLAWGTAVFGDGVSIEDAIATADALLYQRKESSRT